MTWQKLLERVCDATVTSAPRAAGETRQYLYDVSDQDGQDGLDDRDDRTLTPGKRSPTAGGSTMEPERAVRELPDACE